MLKGPGVLTIKMTSSKKFTVEDANLQLQVPIFKIRRHNRADIRVTATGSFSLSPPASLLSQSLTVESYPSLASVDPAIGSWRDSVLSSNSESSRFDLSDDFSSTGGDLLPDEIDQLTLTSRAVEHVADLIARAEGSTSEEIIGILEESMKSELTKTNAGFAAPITTKQELPSRLESIIKRRKVDDLRINVENLTPLRRPFSFFEGDDDRTMSTRIALPYKTVPQPASMIPSPILDHPMARSRREDSTSSLITSFQRSPQLMPRTPSSASSRLSSVTTVRKSSVVIRMVTETNSMMNMGGHRRSE
jgi:hypothetical protein